MTGYASGKYSVALCGRCQLKRPYQELREDGNIPGFYVCNDNGCFDHIDPYKKPPRPADPVTLHHPRPDVPLVPITPDILGDPDMETPWVDQDGNYIVPQ